MFVDALTFLKAETDIAEALGYRHVGTTEFQKGMFRKIKIVETDSVEKMKSEVHSSRSKYEFVAVKPLSFEVAREASRFSMVDAILDPYDGRNDIGIDHITMKFASDNNVAICLSFYKFLMSHRKDRVKTMRSIEKTLRLAMKYSTPIIFCSGAREEYEMRGPRELMSLGIVLGMDYQTALASVSSVPEAIFERNRMKLSGRMFGEVAEDG